jgi:hypothetical protein
MGISIELHTLLIRLSKNLRLASLNQYRQSPL